MTVGQLTQMVADTLNYALDERERERERQHSAPRISPLIEESGMIEDDDETLHSQKKKRKMSLDDHGISVFLFSSFLFPLSSFLFFPFLSLSFFLLFKQIIFDFTSLLGMAFEQTKAE